MNFFSLVPKLESDRIDVALETIMGMAHKTPANLSRFTLQMAEDAPIPMWITTDKDLVIYVNQAYEKEFGRKYADLVDTDWGSQWKPEDAARFQRESTFVRSRKQGICFTQTIEGKEYLVIKYPVNGNKVGGMCIPMETANKANEQWKPL